MERRTPLSVLLVAAISISALLFYLKQSHTSQNGFSIYLTENNVQIISDADILRYNGTSHQITLATGCAERLQKMKDPISGNFTVKLNGEEQYQGIFVLPITSRSYPSTQIVIVYPSFTESYSTMEIQVGYPWDQPTAQDPRKNTKILQHFEKTGRLTQ